MNKLKELFLVLAVCAVAATMAFQQEQTPAKQRDTAQTELVAELPKTDRRLVLVRLDSDLDEMELRL